MLQKRGYHCEICAPQGLASSARKPQVSGENETESCAEIPPLLQCHKSAFINQVLRHHRDGAVTDDFTRLEGEVLLNQ